MSHTIRYLLLAAALVLPHGRANAQSISLRAGTLIQCTLYEPKFSSRTAQIGDPVLCYLRPLREFGQSVFPRGSYLVGRFADYQDPGHFVGKGWLKLEFDRLIISPTDDIPIAAKVVSLRRYRLDPEGKIIGRGHPKRDAFFWTIPILWPVKLLTLPARGPRPTISGEVPITLRLMDDVEIPVCEPQRGPLSLNQGELPVPNASYRERRTGPYSRQIPILENLKDLAWPFIGDRPPRKSEAERRVEDLLHPDN